MDLDDFMLDVLVEASMQLNSVNSLASDIFWYTPEELSVKFNSSLNVHSYISKKELNAWLQNDAILEDYTFRIITDNDGEDSIVQFHSSSLGQMLNDFSFRNIDYEYIG